MAEAGTVTSFVLRGIVTIVETEEQPTIAPKTSEGKRLAETYGRPLTWRKWGPYVSERSWGTVREDYSATGEAWDFLTHDMARSKAYRWGEDGHGRYLRPLPDPGFRAGVLERNRTRF